MRAQLLHGVSGRVMTRWLGRLLRKWPWLHRMVSESCWMLNPAHLAELVLGTSVRERQWANRHLRRGNDWKNPNRAGEDDEWVLSYWDSRGHPHRQFLADRISLFAPFDSILEVGCNCGPNLYLVAQKFPGADIRGIDVNSRSIHVGN